MQESWVELAEFSGYAVSTYGQLMNLKTKRIRKPSLNHQGIAKVTMLCDGRMYTKSIAVLVADTFIPQIGGVYDSLINVNGDRLNNSLDNLMRRPRWFALAYHKQFVDPEFHSRRRRFHLVKPKKEFTSYSDPCVRFGILYKDITRSFVTGESIFPTGQVFQIGFGGN